MIEFIQVESDEHLDCIRELFKEYEKSLGFDLDFQDFEMELAELPGEYAAPDGCLLLAFYENEVAGCAGLTALVTMLLK